MAERQRVRDLEGMDERAAHEFLTELYSLLSAEVEDRISHEMSTRWSGPSPESDSEAATR